MRLPETGKRKYGLEVLKGRNQLCHVHSLAFLVGAVRGLDDKLLHERQAWCSSPAVTVLLSITRARPLPFGSRLLSMRVSSRRGQAECGTGVTAESEEISQTPHLRM